MQVFEIYKLLNEQYLIQEGIKPKKWFDYKPMDETLPNTISYEFRNQEGILIVVHFHEYQGEDIFGIGNEYIIDLSFEAPEMGDPYLDPSMDLDGRGAIKTLGTIAHITDYVYNKLNVTGIICLPATTKHDMTKVKRVDGHIVKDENGKAVRVDDEDFDPRKLNSRGNVYRAISNAMGAKMFDLNSEDLQFYYIFLKDPKYIEVAREIGLPEVDSKGYIRQPKINSDGYDNSEFNDLLSMNMDMDY